MTAEHGPGVTVRILGTDTADGVMTLDRLTDPETGARLAPARAYGGPVAGLPEGQTAPLLAVVDTGLDSSHPWIARTLVDSVDLTGQGEEDRNGHGTWAAILALWVAPMPAGLLNVKALGDDGTGTVDALARGIRWAVRRGATSVNVSAGVSQPSCRADCPLCRAALDAAGQGVVVSAAAGNVAGDTTCPAKAGLLHPGSGVMAVGAMDTGTAQPQPYSGVGNEYLPTPIFTLLPADYDPVGDPAGWDPKYAAAAAAALIHLAIAEASVGHVADAARRFDQVVARCGNAPQPEVRACAGSALVNKGFMFRQDGRPHEELACYGSVVERYGADPAQALRDQVAQARSRRAGTLEQLGDTAGALADYGAIIGDGRPLVGTEPWVTAARALLNRGVLLRTLGRREEAGADFRRLADDYADLAAGQIEVWVVRAMVNLGIVLSEQGDDAAAITQYDDVWEWCADSSSPARRWAAASAMYNRGNCLRRLGREQEAVAAYDQVIARFGDDPAAAEAVDGARTNRTLGD